MYCIYFTVFHKSGLDVNLGYMCVRTDTHTHMHTLHTLYCVSCPSKCHVILPEDSSVPPPPPAEIPDTIAVSSSTDWQAAFGFTSNTESHDDDLGGCT